MSALAVRIRGDCRALLRGSSVANGMSRRRFHLLEFVMALAVLISTPTFAIPDAFADDPNIEINIVSVSVAKSG